MSSPVSSGGSPSSGSSVAPGTSSSGSSPSSVSSSPASVSSTNEPSTPPPASSQHTTSTSNSPTSASPTTESTPTTTPPSSPAQTSSVAVETTPSSPSPTTEDSGSSHSSTTPATTSTSTFTSQVPTTLSSTNAAGSVVLFTTTIPEVITTSITTGSSGGGGTNNTGIIVGAVVGGVTGVILLVILLFCIRKRVRKDEFDGNFDPDRVVGHEGGTLPQVDLAEEVSPFPPNQSYTDQESMRQYEKPPYTSVPSLGGSGYTSTEFYPGGTAGARMSAIDTQPRFRQPGAGPPPQGAYAPRINMYGTGPVDWHTPHLGPSPPPSTASGNTSSTRGAKEREILERSGQGIGLGLATQQEVAEGSGDVVVHQDAGRAPIEEHAPPREIPPAYESIRQD